MTTYLALYRGQTAAEGDLVGVTAEPGLIADVACRLLRERRPPDADPRAAARHRAVKRALRTVQNEARAQLGRDQGGQAWASE